MENVKNGGAGSGDFNHAGNPPHVGGSEPIESRHARGFKSKSERKVVKKEENKDKSDTKDKQSETQKDRGEKRKNKIKEMASQIKESPNYNAEYVKEKINELSEYKKFGKYYFDIDFEELIKEGHGDALEYIGQIYAKEGGKRKEKQKAGFNYLRDIMHEDLSSDEKEWVKDTQANNSLYKHEYIEY